MNTVYAPLSAEDDARNRALRTFVQGLGLDVAVALSVFLAASFTDIQWTREYWVALGLTAARTVLLAAVSYVARKVVPPAGVTVER